MDRKTEERLEMEAEVWRENQKVAQDADAARAAGAVSIERREGNRTRKRTCNKADFAHFQKQGYKKAEQIKKAG